MIKTLVLAMHLTAWTPPTAEQLERQALINLAIVAAAERWPAKRHAAEAAEIRKMFEDAQASCSG